MIEPLKLSDLICCNVLYFNAVKINLAFIKQRIEMKENIQHHINYSEELIKLISLLIAKVVSDAINHFGARIKGIKHCLSAVQLNAKILK